LIRLHDIVAAVLDSKRKMLCCVIAM